VKKLSLEELELIAPELAQKARRHGLESVSIDEVLSCCGKQEQGVSSPLGMRVRDAWPSPGEVGTGIIEDLPSDWQREQIVIVRWDDGTLSRAVATRDMLSAGMVAKLKEGWPAEIVKKKLPVQEHNTVIADLTTAQRQWLWGPHHFGVDKAPKEQVNYRPGIMEGRMELRNQVCASCRFMMPKEELPGFEEAKDNPEGVDVVGRCELVEGDMFKHHTCDLWQPSLQKSGKFLHDLHAAEAVMRGEPVQEHTDREYVESAMEFIEAGENPDAVIDFLLDPEGSQKREQYGDEDEDEDEEKGEGLLHERMKRHYHPELSHSELDSLASKLVAKGYDAKASAPYLITDAPQNVVDNVMSFKAGSAWDIP